MFYLKCKEQKLSNGWAKIIEKWWTEKCELHNMVLLSYEVWTMHKYIDKNQIKSTTEKEKEKNTHISLDYYVPENGRIIQII